MKGVLTDIESIVMWVLTIALVSHLCHFGKLSREKNTTLDCVLSFKSLPKPPMPLILLAALVNCVGRYVGVFW